MNFVVILKQGYDLNTSHTNLQCKKRNTKMLHACNTVHIRVLARPFPKGTVSFADSNVPSMSALKLTMCLLVPLQHFQQPFELLELNCLSIELSEHCTQLECFVDSGTHVTIVVLTITTSKMRGRSHERLFVNLCVLSNCI